MKFSTRGLKTYLQVPAVNLTPDTITNVTNAKPAVVTPTTIASFSDGQVVKIAGTGLPSLDGKYFLVAKIGASTFELQCSDASAEVAPATAGTATPYTTAGNTPALVPFCINSLSRDVPAGEVISVATFCDPDAQVAGAAAGAGSLSWGGPIDFCDKGFQEMQKALADGTERILVVEFPQNIGKMIIPVEINSYSESMEMNAAATWSGGAVVKAKPTYLTCGGCP
jgi:hypothetical protein